MKPVEVAIAGVTGPVGQTLLQMIALRPDIELAEVAASDGRAGSTLSDVLPEPLCSDLPPAIRSLTLKRVQDLNSPYVISALPGDVALQWEMELVARGITVLSNASAYRMHPKVPLIIPEVNGPLLKPGDVAGPCLVANPNCSTVFFCMAVFPLMKLGQILHVHGVTLQAISGAGYPGVPSLDIMANSIPNIDGEEQKIESESRKILLGDNNQQGFSVSSQVNRIAVINGHSVSICVEFSEAISEDGVLAHFQCLQERFPQAYRVYGPNQDKMPQPAKVLTAFDMRVHIGRIRQQGNRITLVALGHNLVRGAAGAAIANLDLLRARRSHTPL